MNKNSIGIIGGGFVGQILKKYYTEAKVYDIKLDLNSRDEVLNQEVIFIAFNLLDNCLSEESYKSVAEYAKQAPENRIFIIKSTFVPGTTDRLQQEFPQHRFVYNPEFLTEATAWWDFTKPWCQIFGCPNESLKLVHDLLISLLPPAPITKVISPLDAEILKHSTNSFYATKVIIFNQIYDACKKLGGDYETVRQILAEDRRIGDSHSIVMHHGYRGFGDQTLSKCIPKDLFAFKECAKIKGGLWDKVWEINENYLEEYYKNKE